MLLETFKTERLVAERVREADFGDLCSMNSSPEVMETLGGLRSDERTRDDLQKNLEHWRAHGFGLWILRSIEERNFVGRSAIRHVNVGGDDEVEIGYAIMPAYWKRGLATEVSLEMVRLAFVELKINELVAFTLPHNVRSRRVIEKVGGIFERDIVHSGYPHVLYRIRAVSQGA